MATKRTGVVNMEAAEAACGRCGATFLSRTAQDKDQISVQLPGWRRQITFDAEGTARFDSDALKFEGNAKALDDFLQYYAVEAGKVFARQHGYDWEEKVVGEDIQLEIFVGSGAEPAAAGSVDF